MQMNLSRGEMIAGGVDEIGAGRAEFDMMRARRIGHASDAATVKLATIKVSANRAVFRPGEINRPALFVEEMKIADFPFAVGEPSAQRAVGVVVVLCRQPL